MNPESCFGIKITQDSQEETKYEDITTSSFPRIYAAAPPRTSVTITVNTGESPVASTAANFYTNSVVVTTPGPTATTAATHQYSTSHTPAKNVRFDETTV